MKSTSQVTRVASRQGASSKKLCPCCGKTHIKQKYFSKCIHCQKKDKKQKLIEKSFKKALNNY